MVESEVATFISFPRSLDEENKNEVLERPPEEEITSLSLSAAARHLRRRLWMTEERVHLPLPPFFASPHHHLRRHPTTSAQAHRMEELHRRVEISSRPREELRCSASMHVPEQSGRNSHNKRPLNVGIGQSTTQPIVDSYLYQTQTSRQPRISNAILKGIKDCKTYMG
jgi:hypothetical protein